MTIRELAEAVIRATGSTSKIVAKPLPIDDPKVRQPDISRARAVLHWEPRVSLETGLQRTVAWFEAQQEPPIEVIDAWLETQRQPVKTIATREASYAMI